MLPTEERKEVSFYDFLKDIEERYPGLNNIAHGVIADKLFPRTQDKNEMYGYLKECELPKYVLEGFQKMWEIYLDSKLATRDVKKQAWEEKRAQYQKEETHLIRRYVSEIRDRVNYYDQSYEDIEEREAISKRRREESKKNEPNPGVELVDRYIREDGLLREKPARMSNEEWVKRKREIRARRTQERSESKSDYAIKSRTPGRIFRDKVYEITCDCEPEQLRQGIYCRTCKLVLRVDKYMMELFKDAAEGRSPSHSLVS